jgi:hypothetical protein
MRGLRLLAAITTVVVGLALLTAGLFQQSVIGGGAVIVGLVLPLAVLAGVVAAITRTTK